MIAEQIGCDDTYVGRIRSEVRTSPHLDYVVGKDGVKQAAHKASRQAALKLEPLVAAKAKANQGRRTDILTDLSKCPAPINTRAEIAKAAGLAQGTIQKARLSLVAAKAKANQRVRKGDQPSTNFDKVVKTKTHQHPRRDSPARVGATLRSGGILRYGPA